MIPFQKKYEKDRYTFPNRDIDPRKKNEAEYCVDNAEAIYSLFLRNKTAFNREAYDTFNMYRLYANGEQPTDQYKSWLLEEESENGESVSTFDDTTLSRVAKRKGFWNVLWDNVSPAPKIMGAIHGMFDDTEWDIFVDNIDRYSKKLLEEEKWKKIVQGSQVEWQNAYKKQAGIPIDEDVVLPKSKEEFDMMAASDGFKLNIAKAMEKLISHTFDVSRWDNVLKRKLVDDLAAVGYAASKDYYDPEDGFFKTKYLDVARLIVQYSIESDYTDAEYAGYFTYITISNLRQKLPDVPEEQIKKLAHTNLGYYDNPQTETDWENHFSKIDASNQTYRYDDFKVPVLECEWIDFDKEKRVEITNSHGEKRYLKKDFDEPVKTKTTKSGVSQRVSYVNKRRLRQCSWVVGTEYAYDYGLVSMAPRPQPSKPRLSFHVEQLMQPSYIRQLRPMLDQIQLIWLRWQNSLAKMIEKGYAINISMLQNISDGEKKWKLGEVVKMWKQTGVLPFMQSVVGGYQGGDVTPVREIAGGLGTRLEESVAAINHQFALIENVVGFNPVSMGSSPDTNAAVRNVQAAMQSTNNVLKPLMKSVMEVKQGVAETTMSRLQVAMRASKDVRESYSGVVNETDIELMRLADKDQVKYGLSMKPRPDAAFRAQLSEYVKVAIQSGRDGKAGLEIPEAMLIDEQLYRGANMTEIRQRISYVIDKQRQNIEKNEKENIQLQNQGLQELEQQKAQQKAQETQMESQIDSNKIQTEGQIDMAQKRFEANNALLMKLVDMSNNTKEGVDNQEAKRRLSVALNIIGQFGMQNVDLAQKLGEVEGGMQMQQPQNIPQGTQEQTPSMA